MGCGSSKDAVRPAKEAGRMGKQPAASSTNVDDMAVEDLDGGGGGGPTQAAAQTGGLLTSWNTPTQNAAHARIIRTVTTNDVGGEGDQQAPRQRTRAAKHDEEAPVAPPPDADSSDDEGYNGGNGVEESLPGAVSSMKSSNTSSVGGGGAGTGVIGMFRPRTPHAVMDLGMDLD